MSLRNSRRYLNMDYFDSDPVSTMNWSRSRRAAALHKMRAKLNCSMSVFKDCDPSGLESLFCIPSAEPKPTAAYLYRVGVGEVERAKWLNSRMGENDTEYYSACGHDDALGEYADAALAWGVSCRIAARRVKWGELNGYAA